MLNFIFLLPSQMAVHPLLVSYAPRSLDAYGFRAQRAGIYIHDTADALWMNKSAFDQ